KSEFGWMNALTGDHPAQGAVGILLQHLDHAFRRFMEPDTQHIGAFFLEYARCFLDVELHLSAEKILGIEPTQDCIAIGDGRLAAAAIEADRTRIGAGTFRSKAHL